MRRLFVGFPLQIESSLSAALKKARINADRREMEMFWVPEANLHVTLNFIGNVEDDRLPALERVLAEEAETIAKVKTSLRGMGAFPDERHMRVLWVGVRKSRALAALQSTLRDRLVEAGFEQEDREYKPHLTVARLKKSRSGADLISPHVRSSFGDVDIDALILFESVMQHSHPIYKRLSRFELTGTIHSEPDLEV